MFLCNYLGVLEFFGVFDYVVGELIVLYSVDIVLFIRGGVVMDGGDCVEEYFLCGVIELVGVWCSVVVFNFDDFYW